MPLTGDFARLQSTIRGLRALARVPAVVSVEGAKAIKSEIDREFATATDPYGQPWAPHQPSTVRRWGKHPLLRLTGAGLASIQVRPMPKAGISVTVDSEGLMFAQGGTRYEVRRRWLPDDRMPQKWRIALEKAAEKAAKEALRGAG
jgi:hypothetical protein